MESTFSRKPLRSGSNRGNARPSGPAACPEICRRALRPAMGTWSGPRLSTAGSRPVERDPPTGQAPSRIVDRHVIKIPIPSGRSHLQLGRKDSDEGRERSGILLSASAAPPSAGAGHKAGTDQRVRLPAGRCTGLPRPAFPADAADGERAGGGGPKRPAGSLTHFTGPHFSNRTRHVPGA